MKLYDRAIKAKEYISNIIGTAPDTCVVLGSGLGAFGKSIEVEFEIPYAEIPCFPVTTVKGHEGKLICGKADGRRILAMQGRFHAYEGYEMEDVTLYVRVLALLGVKNLILTNAAGAVNTSYSPGDLMLITDHISLFCQSPLFGPNDERFGDRFPSMGEAYTKDLQALALRCAADTGISMKQGIYCYCKGPQYETPAEIRAVRTLGADAVGMSTVPEVIVAVHCGMNVLGISCMTNMAAGILDTPLNHKEVMEVGRSVEYKFAVLMSAICKNI